MLIRDARVAEIPRLRDIDWDAGQVFRDIGMPEAAEFEPRTLTELADSQRAGQLWVAADEDDTPASFVMAVLLDGCLHVEQLSTDPASARRGLGRALLDHAADRARAGGLPGLREVRAHEIALGLDRWPRVCMRRDVTLSDQPPVRPSTFS
jgi:GNAT superfamily N-acetyltransferase